MNKVVGELTLKTFSKRILRVLEHKLHITTYDRLISVLFPLYQLIIRTSYLLKGALLYKALNNARWNMVKRIYSVMPYTLVGSMGLEVTYNLCKEINTRNIPGDFVELGVARGGCAALMAMTIFDSEDEIDVIRKLWLFDSFEGLPNPTEDDFVQGLERGTGDHIRPLPKGSCLGTLEEVERLLFGIYNFPEEGINLVKGWFQDTVKQSRVKIKQIAILRIDGDWYESTKVCLEGLYDQVVPGGAIIVDDYESCYGCKKAVDEFLGDRQIEVEIKFDGRGGCYFYKTETMQSYYPD